MIYSPEDLYQMLNRVQVDNPLCTYTLEKCRDLAPKINRIVSLKRQKNALILAHSYVHSDILYGVADEKGDSYELAKTAKNSPADTIVFCGVRFMAETVKILCPEKLVIDPNPHGKCTLADSISEKEVLQLKQKYPHHTFVCYINTTAAVKAHCDVCVTSSNAAHIIERIPNDKIYFLPDRWMGENIANEMKKKGSSKEVLYFSGGCYVHEEFSAKQIEMIRHTHQQTMVLAHPECKPEVIEQADMVGSTSQMFNYVKGADQNHKFLLLTECGIATRLQMEHPSAQIVGSCLLCKYMRSNTLDSIQNSLENPTNNQIIEIDGATAQKAKKCLEAMFYFSQMQ